MKEQTNKRIFTPMNKQSLKDFNIEEARGWTIDRFQQIEYRINEKIVDYFKPVDERKFNKIVLNSSIMDIGSKLKILKNIGTVDTQIIEKIRTLAAIRNGFAHAPIIECISVYIDEKIVDGVNKSSADVESMIEVMNSQGDIKTKNAYDYLKEFWTLNNEIREKL